MKKLLALLFFLVLPLQAQAYTVDQCYAACTTIFSGGIPTIPGIPPVVTPPVVTPPVVVPPGVKPFPGTITWDNTSDQGPVHGTACVLLGTEWLGVATAIIVNGETAQPGNVYRGRPTFYPLKPGDKISRPLVFLIKTTIGDFSYTSTTAAPATGGSVSGYPNIARNGILWKPIADSGDDLVVLINPSYGRPAVKVLDSNKNVLSTGRYVYDSNPNRPTYRFDKPGAAFPRPCLLQVGDKIFTVPDGSRRYE